MTDIKIALTALLAASAALGGNNYSLFHPKPDSMLRPLSTDRPDKTESPYTVDAGHFQVESEIISVSTDETGDGDAQTETTAININNINLKAGVTGNSDIQLVIPTYVEVKTESNGNENTESGTGDIQIRYKYNIYGNDEGDFAFGIMPYVKMPTAKDELSNGEYEGGIMFPFAFYLPNEWSMGTMLQVDNRYSEDDTRNTDYIMTWTFGRPIAGDLSGFIELFTQTSDQKVAAPVTTFDFGFTYKAASRVQLDAGAFIGMTEAADDLATFAGISALF